MATYISKATGNFTSSSTWAPVETGASAAQLSHSATTAIAGAGTATSPTFTGTNGDICDGVLLFLRRGGTTGTITVSLLKGGVAQKTVTVNNSDLPVSPSPVFFKFATTFTFDGSATFAIKIAVSSGGSSLTYYRSATASDMTKLLRLTAAASAPAAGDVFVVVGEQTGAGTSNTFTVTMDDAGTNAYGTNVQATISVPHTTVNGVDVGQGGTLQWATATGTYQLHLKGHLSVWCNATLNIGTSGTPMPDGVTGELYFDNSTDGKFGLECNDGCTVNMYGLTKTHAQFLAADANSGVASFTLDGTPTNWKNGDEVVLASTTQTPSESEVLTLNANVSTTSMTTSANSTAAHAGGGGTNGALVKAEVINITRNVRIKGNVSQRSYVTFVSGIGVAPPAVSLNYVEFKYTGTGGGEKEGVRVESSVGTWTGVGLVVRDAPVSSARGYYLTGGVSGYSLTNSVAWNVGSSGLYVAAPGWTVNGVIVIKSATGAQSLVLLADCTGTLSNITAVSAAGRGVNFGDISTASGTPSGAISNITSHSNTNAGIEFQGNLAGTTISNILSYRNGANGGWYAVTAGVISSVLFDGVTIFGNAGPGLNFASAAASGFVIWRDCTFKNLTVDAGLVLTQAYGIQIGDYHVFDGCTLESSNIGNNQALTTAAVDFASSTVGRIELAGRNNILTGAGGQNVTNQANLANNGYLGAQRHQTTAGLHKRYTRQGDIQIDTTIYDSASPSIRLTPTLTTEKLSVEVAVMEAPNGNAVTASVRVRKSVVGDGAAYNGNQPRLIVKKNVAAGISADTVLATASGAAGSWETLSGATAAVTEDDVLTFIVDCDGTAGWVNVDNASGSGIGNEIGTFRYWSQGLPFSQLLKSVGSRGTMKYWRDGVAYVPYYFWIFTQTISVTSTVTPTKAPITASRVVSVTPTATVTIIRAVSRALSLVTSTVTGSVLKTAARILGLTSAVAPTIVKQANVTKSVTSTATVTKVEQAQRTVSVTETVTPATIKLPQRIVSVVATGTASITDQINRIIVIVSTVVVAIVRNPERTITATSTVTPAITRSVSSTQSVIATGVVTVQQAITRALTIAITSTVTAIVTIRVALTIQKSVTVTATLVRQAGVTRNVIATVVTAYVSEVRRVLSANPSVAPTIVSQPARIVAGASPTTIVLTKTVNREIQVAANATATIVKNVIRTLAAIVPGSTTFTSSLVYVRTAAANSTVTPTTEARIQKTLSVVSVVSALKTLKLLLQATVQSLVTAVILTYKNIDIKTEMLYINDGTADVEPLVYDGSASCSFEANDATASYQAGIYDGTTEYKARE